MRSVQAESGLAADRLRTSSEAEAGLPWDRSLLAVDVLGLRASALLPQRTTNLELERTRGIRLFN
jgi:hypothetical protein